MKTAAAIAAIVVAMSTLSACNPPSVTDEIDRLEEVSAADRAATKAAADAFLAENSGRPGVTTTASGLQYEIVRKGDEKLPHPGPEDVVSVMYEGTLIDGAVFDSSYERNQPATFQVGGVIPGWTEALQLMRPGDEFRLVIPPEIGYGTREKPKIPANSALVFKVELLGFRKPDGTIVAARAGPN